MKSIVLATLPLVLFPVPAVAVAADAPLLAQAFVSNPIQAVNPSSETLYLNNDAVFERSLRVSTATTVNGRSIPAGSTIRGQFEPISGGLRYVATGVEVNNQVIPIQAVSGTLHDVKDPRETGGGSIAGDAAIGAAGGALLGEIFGNASLGTIVGGAAAGVVIGNVTAQRVVVIKPDQVITLQSP